MKDIISKIEQLDKILAEKVNNINKEAKEIKIKVSNEIGPVFKELITKFDQLTDVKAKLEASEIIAKISEFKTEVSDINPLELALENRQFEAAEILVNCGFDVNEPNSLGVTPLIYMIDLIGMGQGNEQAVKWLIDHGANPNIQDNFGSSAFTLAAGNDQLLEILSEAKFEQNIGLQDMDFVELRDLIQAEGIKAIDEFFGSDSNAISIYGAKILQEIAHKEISSVKGDSVGTLINKLVQNGADLNSEDFTHGTPLANAVSATHDYKLAESFLNNGSDINYRNSDGENVLLHVLREDDQYMQEYHSSPKNILLDARWLVSHGANPYEADESGVTAYDFAQKHGYTALTKIFDSVYHNFDH